MIDYNDLPFEEYLDKEDIALIKLLITGRQYDHENRAQVKEVCYHFHYN